MHTPYTHLPHIHTHACALSLSHTHTLNILNFKIEVCFSTLTGHLHLAFLSRLCLCLESRTPWPHTCLHIVATGIFRHADSIIHSLVETGTFSKTTWKNPWVNSAWVICLNYKEQEWWGHCPRWPRFFPQSCLYWPCSWQSVIQPPEIGLSVWWCNP